VVAAVLALTALPSCGARAEDYCENTGVHHESGNNDSWATAEKKIREKCKIGDIIVVDGAAEIGRLCDLHQPVAHTGQWGGVCFLAPPRKTY